VRERGLKIPNFQHSLTLLISRYNLDSKRSSCFFHNGRQLYQRTYIRQLKFKKRHQSQQVILDSKADYSGTTNEEEKEDAVSKATLMWRAAKLPIYSVALVPLTVSFSNTLSSILIA
jgi:hypothetical protein